MNDNFLEMIPLVATAGFLDGIHPCAIAILVFFIAFLMTLQRSVKNIFLAGSVFIFVIFLTYLGIGIGLFSGMTFFGQHHFFARFGAWLLIILGFITLLSGLFPARFSGFKMPGFATRKAKDLLNKATLPAVALAAFLVALCAVPCSGGIYVAVTALLASKTTYFTGFLMLLLYNLMYVLPLIIILILAANPLVLAKISRWRKTNEKSEKLAMGIMTLILGASILLFFI